mgnify:CR=1 FL=1
MNKYEKLFKEITGYDFDRYYLEYKPKLTWYLTSRYTKDEDKSEDFANQAFMQALEKIETYNSEKSKLITWLTKIAINLVIKEWKDNHKYNFISFERDTTEAPSIMNILHYEDNRDELLQEDENKKKCEIVYDVIHNLQDKYKKVMVMRELEHMAYKEIADSIRKNINIDLNKELIKLENPEDFFSLDITNVGNDEMTLKFQNEKGDEFIKIIPSNENVSITRDDIKWERNLCDSFYIDCTKTKATGNYTTTTNLSTIKSQIKKGRELIKTKVKKKFRMISENGIDNYNF